MVFALKGAGPCFRVVRMADVEQKSEMGSIYDTMDRAREVAVQSLRKEQVLYYF